MKKFIFIIFIFFISILQNGFISVKADDSVNDKKVIDLFICMGQSNMAGRGESNLAPIVPNGYAYEFKAISDPTKLYNIQEPFGYNENNMSGINDGTSKTGSMISSFAIAYYNSTNIPGVFISASVGGTSIIKWQPNEPYLNDAINRLKVSKTWLSNNGYTIRHTYMLWCQGETDGDKGMGKYEYTKYLENVINEMSNNGIEKCFLIRIGNNRDNAMLYDNIIQAQTEYSKTHENAVLISNKFSELADRGLMKDLFHYFQEGYNETGEDAGKNCALYVKNGIPPILSDFENKNIYYPFKVTGNNKITFLFNTNNENGSYDIVKCNDVLNGCIDTNNLYGYRQLENDITLSPIKEWSLEFTIMPKQVVQDGNASGILFGNSNTASSNFLYVSNKDNLIRIRDDSSNNIEFCVPKSILDEKHNYCITYDGIGNITLFIDALEYKTMHLDKISDIKINAILGGYYRPLYDSRYDYRGKCYYLNYINKKLHSYEMHIE